MFAFFTLQVPSGLGVYWAMSNIIGVVMYYFTHGPEPINWRTVLLPPSAAPAGKQASRRGEPPPKEKEPAEEPVEEPAEAALPTGSKRKKRLRHGRSRGKRKDRR
jgi:membrane protein insertase Oxa1/YidC/SpoIIIJ